MLMAATLMRGSTWNVDLATWVVKTHQHATRTMIINARAAREDVLWPPAPNARTDESKVAVAVDLVHVTAKRMAMDGTNRASCGYRTACGHRSRPMTKRFRAWR